MGMPGQVALVAVVGGEVLEDLGVLVPGGDAVALGAQQRGQGGAPGTGAEHGGAHVFDLPVGEPRTSYPR